MDEDQILAELLGMGFPPALCDEACRKGFTTLEQKVDWICSNMNCGDVDTNGATAPVTSSATGSVAVESEDPTMFDFKMVFAVRMDLKMKPGKVAAQCVHAALGAVRNSTQWAHFREFVQELEERRRELDEFDSADQADTGTSSASDGGSASSSSDMPVAESTAVVEGGLEESESSEGSETPFVSRFSDEQLQAMFERLRTNVEIWEATGEKAVCLKCPTEDAMELLIDRCCAVVGASGAPIPWHYVIDAGRTQIEAGSMTVLAIGPQNNQTINAITGDLKLY